jgi:superfamily II DNA or RNA helicase
MTDIIITKIDEAYIKVQCEESITRELSEYFTFEVPGAKFMPAYKRRVWDGKLRLFNTKNHQIYSGLVFKINEFAVERGYSIYVESELEETDEVSLQEAAEFAAKLNLPHDPRDYQIRALALAARYNRCVLISPTASGKSLVAYLITRWFSQRTLILVPTISLVTQMIKDFQDYGYDGSIYGVMAGKNKYDASDIVVSTWQSVYEMPPDFFDSFDIVIGDEAHLFKAKSLATIMTNMKNVKYRFGMTGTLDGSTVHELVLEGLFGRIERIARTEELIEAKHLSDLDIKILVLKHPNGKKPETYQEEIDYLVSNESRNKFIRNLALSLKGNTLVLYAYVEKHGMILDKMLREKDPTRPIHFVSGGTHADDREDVRTYAETGDDNIIVASYGTFSTGINIRNLHNIIFASPSKSKIRVLQSIGRGLRKTDRKTTCKLFDIADDISNKGGNRNFTLNHLAERVKIYNEENFPYEVHVIKLKEAPAKNERRVLF